MARGESPQRGTANANIGVDTIRATADTINGSASTIRASADTINGSADTISATRRLSRYG